VVSTPHSISAASADRVRQLEATARPTPITDGIRSIAATHGSGLIQTSPAALLGTELIAAVPEIAQVARVQVEQIAHVSSTDITIANSLTLANRINAIYESDPSVAGVVITHGTNTLEETGRPTNRRRASPIRSSPAPRRLRICLDESSCVGAGSARAETATSSAFAVR